MSGLNGATMGHVRENKIRHMSSHPSAGLASQADNPLVSGIVIFLNAEKFIRESIESVFAQTYDNWELLLVDDGSSDASTEIAKEYARRFPQKVRYLEHPGHQNRGMSASRNLGIENARGSLVAFLDADDIWLPQKLEKQVALIKRHPEVGAVVNPAIYWHENSTKKPQPMTLRPGKLPTGQWIPKVLEDDNNAACPSSILMRKDMAIEIGGFEENFAGPLMVFEDQIMWFKLSLKAPIYYEPDCLTLYRLHSASCCAVVSRHDKLAGRVILYQRLRKLLKQYGREGSGMELLSVMTRCRLHDSILQSPNGRSPYTPKFLPRMATTIQTVRKNKQYLGYFFSGLLLLSAVSSRLPLFLSRRVFAFTKVTYQEGLTRALGRGFRYSLRQTGRIVPRTVRAVFASAVRTTKSAKARPRLTAGIRPLSERWGHDRGKEIARFYLEQFLEQFSSDIRGRCLEFSNK